MSSVRCRKVQRGIFLTTKSWLAPWLSVAQKGRPPSPTAICVDTTQDANPHKHPHQPSIALSFLEILYAIAVFQLWRLWPLIFQPLFNVTFTFVTSSLSRVWRDARITWQLHWPKKNTINGIGLFDNYLCLCDKICWKVILSCSSNKEKKVIQCFACSSTGKSASKSSSKIAISRSGSLPNNPEHSKPCGLILNLFNCRTHYFTAKYGTLCPLKIVRRLTLTTNGKYSNGSKLDDRLPLQDISPGCWNEGF